MRRYVRDLEEVLIRTLADFGITAASLGLPERVTSVWVGDDKIAAIGVHLSRWITTHGFALNVTDEPLRNFLRDHSVRDHRRRVDLDGTDLSAGRPTEGRSKRPSLPRFAEVFGREIEVAAVSSLPAFPPRTPLRLARPEWLKVRAEHNRGVRGGPADDAAAVARDRLRGSPLPQHPRVLGPGEDRDLHASGGRLHPPLRFLRGRQGPPGRVDPREPERVAEAAVELALSHAVVTSVNRDDLPDGGAAHFAATIRAIRAAAPGCTVEVLIPDFCGDRQALETVLAEEPEILNHNTETVPRLYRRVRPAGAYERSLELIARTDVPEAANGLADEDEVGSHGRPRGNDGGVARRPSATCAGRVATSRPSDSICSRTSAGSPSSAITRPEEFEGIQTEGEAMGFLRVESGPLVRSSYHARRALAGPAA